MQNFEDKLTSTLERIAARAAEAPLGTEKSASAPKAHRRHHRWLVPALAGAAVVSVMAASNLIGAFEGPDQDGPAAAGERTPAPSSCPVIEDQEGVPAALTTAQAQRGVDLVGALLRSRFGVEDAALRTGLIGTAIDPEGALVVRVDTTLVDETALGKDLLAAASGSGLSVRTAPSCYPAAELLRGGQTIRTQVNRGSYELSPYDSRWHVTLPPEDTTTGDELKAGLGDLVVVEYSQDGGVRH